MEVNRLCTDDLEYELQIRGLPIPRKTSSKRSAVREAFRVEREGLALAPTTTSLDPVSELCICRAKLHSLTKDIAKFDYDNRENEFRRIYSRLLQLRLRLNRIHCQDQLDSQLLDSLLNDCSRNIGDLNLLYENLPGSTSLSEAREDFGVGSNQDTSREILDAAVPDVGLVTLQPEAVQQGQPASSVSYDLVYLGDKPVPLRESSRVNILSDVRLNVAELYRTDNCSPSQTKRTSRDHFEQVTTAQTLPEVEHRKVSYLETNRVSLCSSQRPMSGSQSKNCQQEEGQDNPGRRAVPTARGSRILRLGHSDEPHCRNNEIPPTTFTGTENGSGAMSNRPNTSSPTRRHSQVKFAADDNADLFRFGAAGSSPKIDDLSQNLASLLDNLQFSSRRCRDSEDSERSSRDIHRWNLKFNGQTSVNDFLDRVEELRVSRGVTKEQLLRSAPEIFVNEALLWYRTCQFRDWDDLVAQLKEAFQPYDYNYSLWDEIRRRTQGAHERVLTFVVAMENLFRKLTDVPSEVTKVQIIRRNLLPYIQSRLATQQINSLSELVCLSKAIEETELRIQRFVPPPTNYRYLLEPELAYHKPSSSSVASISENHGVDVSENRSLESKFSRANSSPADSVVSSSSQQLTCWNCGQSGHRFRNCKVPKRVFCFSCGRENVTSRSCPSCSKNMVQDPQ
ncbi:hypothetical protein SSX86_032700 [Deinandra increscens subsp. villosa]|uniref:CCHC-type domain-containing protein n=1 Tax=Deinandra increscens subsp. villosa TaxID=3103831 RepID=A0AAP0C7C9_9ASTR